MTIDSLPHPVRRHLQVTLTALLIVSGTVSAQDVEGGGAENPENRVQLESFEKVWTTVRDRHWDPELGGLDWNAVRTEFRPKVAAARSQGEVRDLLNEMIGRLGQSHFAIFPAHGGEDDDAEGDEPEEDVEDHDEDESTEGGGTEPAADEAEDEGEEEEPVLEGGSGQPGFEVRIVDGGVFVTRLDADGPAARAGVGYGWEIVKYRGRSVAKWLKSMRGRKGEKLTESIYSVLVAQERLTGPVGKTIDIEFKLPDGTTATKRLKLEAPRGREFSMGHIKGARVWYEARMIGDVGYFALNSFMDPIRVINAFGDAMTKTFAGAKGVVIDIRGNLGGIGFMANGMAGFLIEDSGKNLGTMTTRDSTINFFVNPRGETFTGPVAVLIDGASASTSEIFAGGLKDLGRAHIIGTKSAGAALPSVIEELPNGDRFQFAIADCVSPSGARLEGLGVAPHIEITHTRESLARGSDAAFAAALKWIDSNGQGERKP